MEQVGAAKYVIPNVARAALKALKRSSPNVREQTEPRRTRRTRRKTCRQSFCGLGVLRGRQPLQLRRTMTENSHAGWKRPERQCPLQFRLVVRGDFLVERDGKHPSHAAHVKRPLRSGCQSGAADPPDRALYREDCDSSPPRLRRSARNDNLTQPFSGGSFISTSESWQSGFTRHSGNNSRIRWVACAPATRGALTEQPGQLRANRGAQWNGLDAS